MRGTFSRCSRTLLSLFAHTWRISRAAFSRSQVSYVQDSAPGPWLSSSAERTSWSASSCMLLTSANLRSHPIQFVAVNRGLHTFHWTHGGYRSKAFHTATWSPLTLPTGTGRENTPKTNGQQNWNDSLPCL